MSLPFYADHPDRITPLYARGGASAFDPASLFGVGDGGGIYDYTDISKLFQNSAGTTAVTAAGQDVMYVTDLSGNGLHKISPDDILKGVYQDDAPGGGPRVEFAAGNTLASTGTVLINAASGLTLIAAVQTNLASVELMFGFGNADALTNRINITSDSSSKYRLALTKSTGSSASLRATSAAFPTNTKTVLAGRWDNPDANLWSDGVLDASTGLSSTSFSGTIAATSSEDGNASAIKLWREIGINRPLTDGEVADVNTWCEESAA